MTDVGHAVQPVPLTYADLPEQWGVSCQHEPAAVRVAVGPIRTWGPVFAMYRWWLVGLLAWLALQIGAMVNDRPILWEPIAVIGGVYGYVILLLLLIAYTRLRRRIVFEVTARRFTILIFAPGFSHRTQTWARNEIGDIRFNPYNGKLTVRITGQDLKDIYVSPNRPATEFVARTLDEALRKPLADVAPEQPTPPKSPSPMVRSFALALSFALFLVGLVIFLTGGNFAPCGMYLLFLSAIPAGILLGTQKKEYWI